MEFVERGKSLSFIFVGLIESIDFTIGLWSPHLADRVFDVPVVKVLVKLLVQAGVVILLHISELGAVVGDHLQYREGSFVLSTDVLKELDTAGG